VQTFPCANPNWAERVRPTGPDDGYDDRVFPYIHLVPHSRLRSHPASPSPAAARASEQRDRRDPEPLHDVAHISFRVPVLNQSSCCVPLPPYPVSFSTLFCAGLVAIHLVSRRFWVLHTWLDPRCMPRGTPWSLPRSRSRSGTARCAGWCRHS